MKEMGKKTAKLAAAALLAAALLSAGLWGGNVAHAAPGDIIFPDGNFLQALIDQGADKDASNTISDTEMAALTSLTIDRDTITDITGIGYATGLKNLYIVGTSIQSIPAEISQLTNLTVLEIKDNIQLGSAGLPVELWSMTQLTVLNLYDNGLTTLPDDIGNLTNLTGLFLHHNSLTSLPSTIKNLSNLLSLTVWHNSLTSLPASVFDSMKPGLELDINENYLDPRAGSDDRAVIDAAAAHGVVVTYGIQNQYTVSLNYNGGTGDPLPKTDYYCGESVTLPAATKAGYTFGGWDTDGDGSIDHAAGDSVQIAPNPVTASSVQFDAIYNYRVVFRTQSFGTIDGGTADIAYTLDIGQHVGDVAASAPTVSANTGYVFVGWYDGAAPVTESAILTMDIASNKTFTAVYKAEGTIDFADAGFAAALDRAGVDANHDGFITENEMKARTELSLSEGGFTDIAGIGYAVNLQSLSLGAGRMDTLPAEIGNLTGLTELDLSGNRFTALPAETGNLANLARLDLSGNRFTMLPGPVMGLSGLASLDLSGNLITSWSPERYSGLTGLTALDLTMNYLNLNDKPAELAFASCEPQNTYAVVLDANGGSCAAMAKPGYWYNETFALPQPVKAGYAFVGWDKNGDGAADVAAGGTDRLSPAPPDAVSSAAYAAVYRSSNAALSGIGLSAGAYLTPAFDPNAESYTVTLYDYVGAVTITPARADPGAALAINGAPAADITVALANPGDETSVSVRVTAEDGVTARTCSLRVRRAPSVSLDLSSISLSPGVNYTPVFTPSVTSYSATVPVSTAGVSVSAVCADGAASVSVNGAASGSAISVAPGMTETVTITVSSPATTDRIKTYTVDLKRGTSLSGFSAKPKVGKTYTLSPGGTNRLSFNYNMAGPGTVKIEVLKGKKWIRIMTRTESSAGAKTWAWNGKVSGRFLAVGTYKARITPSAFGMTGRSSTITFKIVRYPSVAWKTVAKKFRATGANRTLCVFRVNNPTNAVVRVYNARGKIVAVVKSVTNLLPASSASVVWNGRATAGNTAKLKTGALVPKGSYTIRIAVGTKVYTRAIKITR